MTQAPTVHVHRPKVEYFDITSLTNTDPKGFVRPVDRYELTPWGLYMGRPSDHQDFHYLESWLLPELAMRVTKFHRNPGAERDEDYYVDIGEFRAESEERWISVDHYLDIIVRTGRGTDLLDVDELLAALVTGHLDAVRSQAAIEHATTAVESIAAHGYSLERWLDGLGIVLTWR